VASRTGLSLRTLRHYDEVGLVRPSGRTDGGFRLYTEQDVERLLVVRRMQPLGFTLEEMADRLGISDRLAGGDVAPRLRERLAVSVETAEERRADLARKLGMADEFIAVLKAR